MYETFLIQATITREAYGLASAPDPTRPVDHPSKYETFECKLPLRMATIGESAVTWDALHLVLPPAIDADRAGREHSSKCGLCVRPFVTKSIYRLWSHVKYRHNDLDERIRLQTVKMETATYLEWINRRKAGRMYLYNNPTQWQRMQQTQIESFDWDQFCSWKLPDDVNMAPQIDKGIV